MTAQLCAVHLVIWHPDGRRVLRCGAGWPTLELLQDQDIAGTLQAKWNLSAWLLHGGGLSVGQGGQPRLQLLVDDVPDGMHWEEVEVSPLAHARPWQLAGWPVRARERLDGALKSRGLTRRGELTVEVVNDLACVMRAEAGAGSVFLKVSDSPREAEVTAFLSNTVPEVLPPVLWSDPASNSLLTLSGGKLLDGVEEVEIWLEAVRQLARFQKQADAGALAALGCPAFPLPEMAERVDALLAETQVLLAWGLEAESLARLTGARPAIRAAFRELQALNLPELPAHGDAHPRNALSGERGPVWFDWAETASAAHPFMDAGWFLALTFHPVRSELPVRRANPTLERDLGATYLTQLGCPDAAPLLSCAVPLALLDRAVVYDARFRHWEGTLPGWRPNFVPHYLRLAARELARLSP